jgi:hypothetical protein
LIFDGHAVNPKAAQPSASRHVFHPKARGFVAPHALPMAVAQNAARRVAESGSRIIAQG